MTFENSEIMSTAVVWFRNILRLHDNPVLTWASSSEEISSVVPIYILDEKWNEDNNHSPSPNRKKFLYESILNLNRNLEEKYQTNILVFSGNPVQIINSIFGHLGQGHLLSDYCSEHEKIRIMDEVQSILSLPNVKNKVFPAVNTILDIEEVIKKRNYFNPKSMKDIETIFNNNLDKNPDGYLVGESLACPKQVITDNEIIDSLVNNKLLSEFHIPIKYLESDLRKIGSEIKPNISYFLGGEDEALNRLKRKVSELPNFVNEFRKPKTVSTNEEADPREPSTTGLSPYISNGCLSVRLLWNECKVANFNSTHTKPPESLIGQLMFREMFYLLSRTVKNWDDDKNNSNCKPIDWGEYDIDKITAWESGMTGFPYIDAMMRQLESTGWMHHLGRHAVSCFLTRGQLWQNWKIGRDIFDRKLVDADWALNNGNWLWLAGVAPFSMPYYRIYNPCPDSKSSLNVETVNADFIRHWIPELVSFPSKYIFEPQLAPLEIQKKSKCIIGEDYPNPIVNRKETRKENLIRFKESNANLKKSSIQ